MTTAHISHEEDCMPPLSPTVLRRFFHELLKQTFTDPNNYGAHRTALECVTAGNGLDIGISHNYDPADDPQYKRSVVFRLGGLKFIKKVVDNFEARSDDFAESHSVVECQASFRISHIMESSDAAYQLGEISTEMLIGLKRWIEGRLGLRTLQVVELAEPKLLKPYPESFFTVDLNGVLIFNYTMTTVHESHRLKVVTMTLET